MNRLTAVVVAYCAVSTPAFAHLNTTEFTHVRPELGTVSLPVKYRVAEAVPAEQPSELAVTDSTEVLVDGRDCELAKVPANATVVRVEVGADRKTVLKIEFSTKR